MEDNAGKLRYAIAYSALEEGVETSPGVIEGLPFGNVGIRALISDMDDIGIFSENLKEIDASWLSKSLSKIAIQFAGRTAVGSVIATDWNNNADVESSTIISDYAAHALNGAIFASSSGFISVDLSDELWNPKDNGELILKRYSDDYTSSQLDYFIDNAKLSASLSLINSNVSLSDADAVVAREFDRIFYMYEKASHFSFVIPNGSITEREHADGSVSIVMAMDSDEISFYSLTGTSSSEILIGSSQMDFIFTANSPDVYMDADIVFAGAGSDSITSYGNAIIYAGEGNDHISLGSNMSFPMSDIVYGGDGYDTVSSWLRMTYDADIGDLTLTNENGDESFNQIYDIERMNGGFMDDVFISSKPMDFYGNGGNDRFDIEVGSNVIGGYGSDYVTFERMLTGITMSQGGVVSAAGFTSSSSLSQVSFVVGTRFNDHFSGKNLIADNLASVNSPFNATMFQGGAGNDTFDLYDNVNAPVAFVGGRQVAAGGSGNDTFVLNMTSNPYYHINPSFRIVDFSLGDTLFLKVDGVLHQITGNKPTVSFRQDFSSYPQGSGSYDIYEDTMWSSEFSEGTSRLVGRFNGSTQQFQHIEGTIEFNAFGAYEMLHVDPLTSSGILRVNIPGVGLVEVLFDNVSANFGLGYEAIDQTNGSRYLDQSFNPNNPLQSFTPSISSSNDQSYHLKEASSTISDMRSRFDLGDGKAVPDIFNEGTSLSSVTHGSSGNDILSGTSGNDEIKGYSGDDIIKGSLGYDLIYGGDGFDTIDYSESVDGIYVQGVLGAGGLAAGDYLVNIERIIGTVFSDTIEASLLFDYQKVLSVWTGDGDDLVVSAYRDGVLDGGDGTDTLSFDMYDYWRMRTGSAGVDVQLSVGAVGKYRNFEILIGSSLSDKLQGTDLHEFIDGGEGDDLIIATLGADILRGWDGFDTVDFSYSINSVVMSSDGTSVISGYYAGTLLSGFEAVIGSVHDDILYGGTEDNTIIGGGGADTIYGGDGFDTADYRSSDASIFISNVGLPGAGGHATDDTLFEIERIIGSAYGDVITGNGSFSSELNGWDGDDTLISLGSADLLIGGAGFDTVDYSGSDQGVYVSLDGNAGFGGHAEGDEIFEVEAVIGSAFNDVIHGSSGDDVLFGGHGNDLLSGSDGADIYVIDFSDVAGGDDTVVDFGLYQDHDIVDLGNVDVSELSFSAIGNDILITNNINLRTLSLRDQLFSGVEEVRLHSNGSSTSFDRTEILALSNLAGYSIEMGDFSIPSNSVIDRDVIMMGVDPYSFSYSRSHSSPDDLILVMAEGQRLSLLGIGQNTSSLRDLVFEDGTRISIASLMDIQRFTGTEGDDIFDNVVAFSNNDGGNGSDTYVVNENSISIQILDSGEYIAGGNEVDTLISTESSYFYNFFNQITGVAFAGSSSVYFRGIENLVGSEFGDIFSIDLGDDYLLKNSGTGFTEKVHGGGGDDLFWISGANRFGWVTTSFDGGDGNDSFDVLLPASSGFYDLFIKGGDGLDSISLSFSYSGMNDNPILHSEMGKPSYITSQDVDGNLIFVMLHLESIENIYSGFTLSESGSELSDTISINKGIVYGLDGNDIISVLEGTAYGNAGDDVITIGTTAAAFGGDGNDTIHLTDVFNQTAGGSIDGGNGYDVLVVEEGLDFLYMQSGELKTISGSETISFTGIEEVNVSRGVVHGSDGDDIISMGIVSSSWSSVEIYAGAGNDVITGKAMGLGYLAPGLYEGLHGGAGDDTITAIGYVNAYGGDGDDIIFGGSGSERLNGGSGDDVITAGDIDPIMNMGTQIRGGLGTNVIHGKGISVVHYDFSHQQDADGGHLISAKDIGGGVFEVHTTESVDYIDGVTYLGFQMAGMPDDTSFFHLSAGLDFHI